MTRARAARRSARPGDLHGAPPAAPSPAAARYSTGKRSPRAECASAYRKAFRAFDAKFPWFLTYSAWNEINHPSQPTIQ